MFWLVFVFFYLFSLLPLRVLFAIGDIFTFLVRDLVGYRRKLVYSNIRKSFPEKSDAEIHRIVNHFYRNFTDNWMETIKLLSISKKQFNRRYLADYSNVKKFYKTGKSLVVMGSHVFNWEYANSHFAMHQPYPFLGVYMPISNPIIDKLFIRLRSRTGSFLIKATDIRRELVPWRGKQYAIGLIADQSPGSAGQSYWLNFLHRPTAFVKGPEKSAKAMNAIVVYAYVSKLKRGYYSCSFEIIAEDPSQTGTGEITRRYVNMLEKNIRQNPSIYLWSHNRWKAAWAPDYAHNWVGESPIPA